jgi:hypothetical protein
VTVADLDVGLPITRVKIAATGSPSAVPESGVRRRGAGTVSDGISDHLADAVPVGLEIGRSFDAVPEQLPSGRSWVSG